MSDSADTGALDMSSAIGAFEALDAGDVAPVDETPEAAAERLAAEDAEQKEPEQSEEEEAGEPEAPDTVTIEVDGKSVQMTKAELAEAVKGQMRQNDYTQKTMAAAAETKAAQAAKESANAEREKLAQQLHTYTVQSQGALANIEAQMTEELLHSDPVHYMLLQRTLTKGQADLQKANGELAQLQQQYQAEQAEKQRSYLQSQHQALLGKLPDWKDPVKAKEESHKVKEYLASQDFNAEDLENMTDHRHVVLARKAMLYDNLMQRAGVAAKKVVAAPAKVERAGVPTKQAGAQETQAKLNAKVAKTGKVTDAAAAFANMF